MSWSEATPWYEEVRTDPNPLHWVIEYDGRFVGTARLHMLNQDDQSARYAVGLLDPTVLGRGVGTAVTELVLRYSFRELRLHRVELRVLDFNTRAMASYTKSGFVEEGRLRQAAFVDGTWHDDVMMSIRDFEWRNSREGNAAADDSWMPGSPTAKGATLPPARRSSARRTTTSCADGSSISSAQRLEHVDPIAAEVELQDRAGGVQTCLLGQVLRGWSYLVVDLRRLTAQAQAQVSAARDHGLGQLRLAPDDIVAVHDARPVPAVEDRAQEAAAPQDPDRRRQFPPCLLDRDGFIGHLDVAHGCVVPMDDLCRSPIHAMTVLPP